MRFTTQTKRLLIHRKVPLIGHIAHLLVRFAPDDAWNGELRSLLEEEQHRMLLRAMELGRQFYRDFAFFHHENEPHSEDYVSDLMKALIAVQQLGKLYALNCLG